MNKHITTILLLSIFAISVYGQDVNIQFEFTIKGESVELEKNYYLPAIKDSIQFETLKCYVSDIKLLKSGKQVATAAQQHWLIDIENPTTIQISNIQSSFDEIQFQIGIDSLTNVSGAFGGDLDPTNGMYWTWQSGYINFKIEGYSPSCPARHHFFQYHIGGYNQPFNALQTVKLPVEKSKEITINIEVDQLFNHLKPQLTYEVMSPSATSKQVAEWFAHVFKISQ